MVEYDAVQRWLLTPAVRYIIMYTLILATSGLDSFLFPFMVDDVFFPQKMISDLNDYDLANRRRTCLL